jgi:hypothetical protein
MHPTPHSLTDQMFDSLQVFLTDSADSPEAHGQLDALLDLLADALRRHSWNPTLREDAAHSALITFLRRVRGGEYDGSDPRGLAGILLGIAADKARRDVRVAQHERPGLPSDRPAGVRTPLEVAISLEEQTQQTELVRRQRELARQLIEEIRARMKNKLHRDIYKHFLACQRGTSRLTQEQIGAQVGCSVRTVGRIWNILRKLWTAWATDAHLLLDGTADAGD